MRKPISADSTLLSTFPFLAPNAARNDFTQPFIITQVGQHVIGFVVGKASEEVVPQADVIVALGDPEDSEHIDVVIRSR